MMTRQSPAGYGSDGWIGRARRRPFFWL